MAHATPVIVASYAEIALKGKNRHTFMRRLLNNLRSALAGEQVASIDHVESRLLVSLDDPARTEAVLEKMRRVFGLASVSPAVPIPRSEVDEKLDSIGAVAAELALADKGDARHFKVKTRRSDRAFSRNSPEISGIVGAAVQAAVDLPVRLARPDLTVHVLVLKEKVLVFTRKLRAFGGLPAGTGGRVTVLLSGGIDSPVASWLLMKRGCVPNFVHFYTGRTAAEADTDNIKQLVSILGRYSPIPLTLFLVPVYGYEIRAIGQISTNFDMVMFRRFMVKCAERIARQTDCLALVTGDSLGQVASQTLFNLAAISPDVQLPIFRPLIGLDKIEITDRAKEIGTYETSILPYRDCCSIRSPRPILNARAHDVMQYSVQMDLDGAVSEAISEMKKLVLSGE
ncbi:MAG: tRNA uracil 4-sulfurtransferase ThiI [bacterium]